MTHWKTLLAATLVAFLSACSTAKMSAVQPAARPAKAVTTIALAPGSGVMGEAIGVELFNRGITVVDADQARSIMARAGLQEYEMTTTAGYAALREKGLEAVLTVKAVAADDGTPESASVRVTDTATGAILAGLSWQNGWGGMRGSMADRTMRANLSSAAQEIAAEIHQRLSGQ